MEIKHKRIANPMDRIFGEGFNFPLLISTIRKSIVWIALFLLVAVVIAFIYLRYTPTAYEASSKIIYKEAETTKALDFVGQQARHDAFSDVEVIRSSAILHRALAMLPLEISYFSKGKFMNTELYASTPFLASVQVKQSEIYDKPIYISLKDNQHFLLFDEEGKPLLPGLLDYDKTYELAACNLSISLADSRQHIDSRELFFVINNNETLINNLRKNLSISVVNSRSQILSIQVRDNVASKASDWVNAIAEVFVKYDRERQMESADHVLEFIDSQMDTLMTDLLVSEREIRLYKQDNKIVSPETEQTFLQGQLDVLDEKMLDLENDLRTVKWLEDYIKDGHSLSAIPFSTLGNFSDFSGAITQIIDLENQKNELLIGLTPNHLRVKFINDQIEKTKSDLLLAVINAKQKINQEYQRFKSQYSQYEFTYLNLPEKQAEILRLTRLYDLKQKYYLQFKEKSLEYEIIKAGIVSKYSILERATNGYQVAPRRRFIQLIALFIGLVFGIGLVVLRYLMQNKILSLRDLEDNTDIPILGIVPHLKRKMPQARPVVFNNPKSIVAESFRSIRTNLEFLHAGKNQKTIAITSTISGEGKTFAAVNLACVLQMAGNRVVLIDLDLRKPKIHQAFDFDNSQGMTTLLIGRQSWQDSIRKTKHEGLDVITAGPVPPNPAELLLSNRFREMLQELTEMYDKIVIDTAPIALVTDAMQLMQLIDYPVFVYRAEYSERDFLNLPNRWFEEKRIQHLSIILNDVKLGSRGYGPYGRGYGYGYGYYSDDHQKNKKWWRK